MGVVSRVLPAEPVTSLAAHLASGGGRGLETAHKLGAPAVIAEMEASGLRGRGGAGFPTGVKWRTVAGFASAALPATVVVNSAEYSRRADRIRFYPDDQLEHRHHARREDLGCRS